MKSYKAASQLLLFSKLKVLILSISQQTIRAVVQQSSAPKNLQSCGKLNEKEIFNG
jgi:hypothetical protein